MAVRQVKGFKVHAGCHWFTLAQAREHWGEGYSSNGDPIEINAKLGLIEAVAIGRGWVKPTKAKG